MEQLTETQKLNMSTTEISKRIKSYLKAKFPKCKFSVRSEYYSMGSSITVSLMQSDIKVKRDFKDIDEMTRLRYNDNGFRDDTKLEVMQEEEYHQLSEYTLREGYDSGKWCNGVFLTEKGYNLLKEIVRVSDCHNWDKSDSMTDYYNVNFSFHLHLGKWNKPFIDGEVE